MECGTKMEYADKRPNFCNSCGVSLTGKKPVAVAAQKQEEVYEDEEEEVGSFKVPHFDPNDLVIDVKPKLTFANIVGTSSDRPVDVRPGVGKNGLNKIRESVKSLKPR